MTLPRAILAQAKSIRELKRCCGLRTCTHNGKRTALFGFHISGIGVVVSCDTGS